MLFKEWEQRTAAQRQKVLARWLFAFDAVILTSVGGMAFGGSASHVYRLALQNGQEGFGAISVTALAEILFAYSGLEVRRRAGWNKGVPIFWLLLTAGFIIWANLESTTVHTHTGYIIAVAPAVVFAGVATTAETRQWGQGKRETFTPMSSVNSSDSILRMRIAADMATEGKAVHTASAPVVVASQPRRTVARLTDNDATPRQTRQAALQAVGREYLTSLSQGREMTALEVAQRLSVSRQRAYVLIKGWKGRAGQVDD